MVNSDDLLGEVDLSEFSAGRPLPVHTLTSGIDRINQFTKQLNKKSWTYDRLISPYTNNFH